MLGNKISNALEDKFGNFFNAFAVEKVYMAVEKSKDEIGLTRLCAPLREGMAHFKGVLTQRPRNNG